MNSRVRKIMIGVSVGILAIQDTTSAQVHILTESGTSVMIEVVNARPLSAGLQLISAEFPMDMTYEDPRYVYAGDLDDITLEVRADLDQYADPSEAPRVIVPRRTQALTTIVPISINSTSRDDWLSAIDSIVRAQNEAGTGGRFRLEESFGAVHVIPTGARDETGRFQPRDPILDRHITISAQELSGLGMLNAICEAISVAEGGTFTFDPDSSLESLLKPLRVPVGLLSSYRGLLEANDEPAREVLLKMLRGIDDESIWQAFVTFDPNYDNYWINIRHLGRPDQAESSEQSPSAQDVEDLTEGGFVIPVDQREQFFRRSNE